uniref:Uncharacterized protein n=1 Tax=Rhodopseudomonas palustris (strain BisA53) TaxID=316055 RepID=Q07PV2_RHOP5
MKKLAIAAAIAAGLALSPIQAQAYDDIGPPLVGGLVAVPVIGGADPYGYYGPGHVVTGGYGQVFHGPFYDHTVVSVPRRIGRGSDRRAHRVNYYYPAPAYYGRPRRAGWGW